MKFIVETREGVHRVDPAEHVVFTEIPKEADGEDTIVVMMLPPTQEGIIRKCSVDMATRKMRVVVSVFDFKKALT